MRAWLSVTGERTLPSGIVAFVFSDIEGSTRLFRRLGEAYVDVLERHNELLRAAWADHDGVEIKNEGDGFFVAFHDADEAVQACVAAQRSLGAETWPEGIEVCVRMGIHAGLAYPRGDDYVALAVHQAARVESAGHGGQILVSDEAAALVHAAGDVTLEPLGTFRVRDFDDPVRLFQVHADGLESRFPAVRAIPTDQHNLTRPTTTFVGRSEELDALGALLDPGRLVTLTGPGGVGKTRLATELGLAVAPHRHHGVWMVDLSPIEDPTLIPDAIATALGVAVRNDGDAWSAVTDHLRGRETLVILDTAEHLLDALVPRVAALLNGCPSLTILVTSRAPLGAPGEQLFRLGPLETAAGDGPSPAMELFTMRASSVDPGFRLDEATSASVAAICRDVDGLPFAIELAAARVGVLSVDEILAGLRDRFRLLRSRDATVHERQRTLEALIEWSVRLLAPPERALLPRLGVFSGSFGLAEAAAVAPEEVDPLEVPDLVWSLAESSLLTVERSAGASRYRLLDSVRAYAERELERCGWRAGTLVGLGRWYVARFFEGGRFRRDLLPEVQGSIDSIRGVLASIEPDDPETAQWLACVIGEQSVLLTRFRAGAEELRGPAERLIAPTVGRVHLLVVFADLLLWSGETDRAAEVLDAAEDLRAVAGTPSEATDWSIAYDRADLARRAGDPRGAIEMVRRTLDVESGDAGRSRMLNLLGVTQYELGNIEAAHAAFEEGLEVDRRVQHHQNVAIAHANLAETAAILGRRGDAAAHALQCLRRSGELGMTATVGMSMFSAAHLVADDGDLRVSVRLAARAQKLYEATGFEPAADEQGPTIEGLFEQARAALGDDTVDAERTAGRALPLPEAIRIADEVLATLAERTPSSDHAS